MLAGISLLAALALGYLHHPSWLALGALGALNLAVSAVTDRCAVKTLLIRLGFPGERELGRAESPPDPWPGEDAGDVDCESAIRARHAGLVATNEARREPTTSLESRGRAKAC